MIIAPQQTAWVKVGERGWGGGGRTCSECRQEKAAAWNWARVASTTFMWVRSNPPCNRNSSLHCIGNSGIVS
jgi:hypothetical protein